MDSLTVKLARIGNSRGIRLPAALIRRYGFRDTIKLQPGGDGILLIPTRQSAKMTWEQTAGEMASSSETWEEWETFENDGLASVPWETQKRAPRAK